PAAGLGRVPADAARAHAAVATAHEPAPRRGAREEREDHHDGGHEGRHGRLLEPGGGAPTGGEGRRDVGGGRPDGYRGDGTWRAPRRTGGAHGTLLVAG